MLSTTYAVPARVNWLLVVKEQITDIHGPVTFRLCRNDAVGGTWPGLVRLVTI